MEQFLTIVDVPVIFNDEFQQFKRIELKMPQISSCDAETGTHSANVHGPGAVFGGVDAPVVVQRQVRGLLTSPGTGAREMFYVVLALFTRKSWTLSLEPFSDSYSRGVYASVNGGFWTNVTVFSFRSRRSSHEEI